MMMHVLFLNFSEIMMEKNSKSSLCKNVFGWRDFLLKSESIFFQPGDENP